MFSRKIGGGDSMGVAEFRSGDLPSGIVFRSLARLANVELDVFGRLNSNGLRHKVHLPERELNARDSGAAVQVIVDGWAARRRTLPDGRRQIFNLLLPGDVVVPRRGLGCSDGPTALTLVETVDFGALRIAARNDADLLAGLSRAQDSAAAHEDVLVYDQIVRLGQQNAVERCAHLFLELYRRLVDVGLARGGSYALPLKQEHLGDVLGMTHVHLNRTLQRMRSEGLIELGNGRLSLLSIPKLASLAQVEANSLGPNPVREQVRSRAGAGLGI